MLRFYLRSNADLITGSPSSKSRNNYEHQRASALLRIKHSKYKDLYRKNLSSVTYENETISIKNSLPYLKMGVTSLLCGPRADLLPFYGFLCKRFSKTLCREKTGKSFMIVFLPLHFVVSKGI